MQKPINLTAAEREWLSKQRARRCRRGHLRHDARIYRNAAGCLWLDCVRCVPRPRERLSAADGEPYGASALTPLGMSQSSVSVPPLPETGNEAVHEPLALREIPIAKTKQVMTSDHNAPTCSPLQQLHRIVAKARSFSSIAQLFVDRQSNGHGI